VDSVINISTINDFLFCPKSLYFHSIYSNFNTPVYHDLPQIRGTIAHNNIENQRYSTSKHILQGISVYSSKLRLKGKIDIYDSKLKYLIERKYRVKRIYKGFKYQLYAQMYCLEEAGLQVNRLFIQSLSDNKRYEIPLPSANEIRDFELLIINMESFTSDLLNKHSCKNCGENIYSVFNW